MTGGPENLQVVVNGRPQDLAAGMTLSALLAELKVPSKGVAVEVNEQIVPRASQESWQLKSGDRVEVVSFVGGG